MIININKKNYMLADDVIKSCPIWCKSIRNGRELIKKKNINEKDYIFARLINDDWDVTDGKSIKCDKVLIRKKFLDTCESYTNEMNEKNNNSRVEEAPSLITLKKDEKFTDNNGNVLEIETRGTRNQDDIFFKVKDVSVAFEMKTLYTTLLDGRFEYTYEPIIDYKYFSCTISGNSKKKSSKKELFLTYQGLLRVLFVSRNDKTISFTKWATDTLFTAHLGTKKQKAELASKLMGISADVIKEVFKLSANTVPCVYLFSINTVKELRESMNIDEKYSDNMLVCKYGYTDSLARRTDEHKIEYGKIQGADLKLRYYSYIDPQYISDAETDIRNLFNLSNMGFKYKNHEEIVIIDPKVIKTIEKNYKQVGDLYGGHIKDLIAQIEKLKTEKEMTEMKLNNEISTIKMEKEMSELKLTSQLELKNSQLELKNSQIELMKKDYEILQLKNECLTLKLQNS